MSNFTKLFWRSKEDDMILSQPQIEACFKKKHQMDVLDDLYRLVIPNYDRAVRVIGFPIAGKELSGFIWEQFMKFDRLYHPEVLNGGCWMNHGFSTDKSLDPWEVSINGVNVIYEAN